MGRQSKSGSAPPRKRAAQPSAADITGAALEALLERHGGRISPAIVLEAARDPASPLHDHFEWDDDRASEQYRLAQASQLIRRWRGVLTRAAGEGGRVAVTITRRVESPFNERAKGAASYGALEDILADPVRRDDLLNTVLRELRAYRRRYAGLAALGAVWAAVDEAVELHDPGRETQPAVTTEARKRATGARAV